MTNSNLEKGIPGALAPIGPANGAGPRPVKARPARGRRTSATDAAPCTVGSLQAQDRGWPGAAYSGSYDPWQVHQGEAGSGQAFCRAGPADAGGVGRA